MASWSKILVNAGITLIVIFVLSFAVLILANLVGLYLFLRSLIE